MLPKTVCVSTVKRQLPCNVVKDSLRIYCQRQLPYHAVKDSLHIFRSIRRQRLISRSTTRIVIILV